MSVVRQAGRAGISPFGLVYLAIASVGWGLNFQIMKHLLTEWPPLSSRGLCGIVGHGANSSCKKGGASDAPPFELRRTGCGYGQGCR
jgi:hypothetical protein